MTITLESAVERFGVGVLDHLDMEVSIPVVDFGRQGDVIVIPGRLILDELTYNAATPVPSEGVAVVRSENGGNTHLLLADGDVRFDAREATTSDLTLGVLTVAQGSTAYLAHPEHGYIGFHPGTYHVRRQREQAEIVRLVKD